MEMRLDKELLWMFQLSRLHPPPQVFPERPDWRAIQGPPAQDAGEDGEVPYDDQMSEEVRCHGNLCTVYIEIFTYFVSGLHSWKWKLRDATDSQKFRGASFFTISRFSWVSIHLRVSTHPPFLIILWVACIYTLYVQTASPCKCPPPFFGPLFQAPMGTYMYLENMVRNITVRNVSQKCSTVGHMPPSFCSDFSSPTSPTRHPRGSEGTRIAVTTASGGKKHWVHVVDCWRHFPSKF